MRCALPCVSRECGLAPTRKTKILLALVRESRWKQKIRRKGFVCGLFAGMAFVGYKVFKHPGSIARSDVWLCVAVVLCFGLAGGLIGLALGAILGSSDAPGGDR